MQRHKYAMGENYLKTAENEPALDGHYLLTEDLKSHRNSEGKIFITVIEKNVNIITNCIQTFT